MGGIFTALSPLLGQTEALTVILTANGETMTATVMPKTKANDDKALAHPLQLTGTAAELDEGFVNAITSFSAARQSLAEQVEAANAVMEAAKQASAKKAASTVKSASKTKAAPAKPAATSPCEAGDADDDDDDGEQTGGSQQAAPAEAGAADNIFV